MLIGLIAVTAAGRERAARLARAWPGQTRTFHGPARQTLPVAWAQCDGLVCFLAVGATVRLIAPLLDSKWTDPAVVCVDESGRHAVAVVGGHAAGANALAGRVADALATRPVITTATEVVGLPGLDQLGWPAEGVIGLVSRAMLDGDPVRLEADATWPLPPLPDSIGRPDGEFRILITDRLVGLDGRTAILRPPSLVVGVTARPGTAADELLRLVDTALVQAALSPSSVSGLACLDAEAAEPGIAAAARRRHWTLLPVADRPGPAGDPGQPDARSGVDAAAAEDAGGTDNATGDGDSAAAKRAEQAARAAGAERIAATLTSPGAAVAVARIRPRGRLALIGLGPGARDLLVPRAVSELRRSSVVVGSGRDVARITDLLRPGTSVLTGVAPGAAVASGAGGAAATGAATGAPTAAGSGVDIAEAAVQQARLGRSVALVGAGDAGTAALGRRALAAAGADIDVVAVPGVTLPVAAAALVGAPLGHEQAVICLGGESDWPAVERRVHAVAEADFVVALCHPVGPGAADRLAAVLKILAGHRPPATPVAVVRDAGQPGSGDLIGTLKDLDARAAWPDRPDQAAAGTVVIVGASDSSVTAGRFVTAPPS